MITLFKKTAHVCECCGEAEATTRVPYIGRVCDECVILLDRVHVELSDPTRGLSGCAPKPDKTQHGY